MPLGHIDAASQRSAPGFPAILARFATDLASIFRIALRSDSRIASSSSTTRPWSPLARHPILPPASSAFVRRQREPKGRAMPTIALCPQAASVSLRLVHKPVALA